MRSQSVSQRNFAVSATMVRACDEDQVIITRATGVAIDEVDPTRPRATVAEVERPLRLEGRPERGKRENEKAKSAHAGMTVSEDPNGGKANMHVAGQSVQRVGEWGIPLASSGYVAQFVLSARTPSHRIPI